MIGNLKATISASTAAILVLVLLLGPASAKNGGSASPHSPVSTTSSSVKSVKPITTLTKKSTRTLPKSEKLKLDNAKIDQQKKDAQQKSDLKSGMSSDTIEIQTDNQEKAINKKTDTRDAERK